MERPTPPVWLHGHAVWIFNGASFLSLNEAKYRYTNALLEYCDYLEAKVVALATQYNRQGLVSTKWESK